MKVSYRSFALSVIVVMAAVMMASCPLPYEYNGKNGGNTHTSDPSTPDMTAPVIVSYSVQGGTSGTTADGGSFVSGQTTTVTVSTSTLNAVIFYTDNGTSITDLRLAKRIDASSGTFTVSRSTTLQSLDIHAVAVGSNMLPSPAVHAVMIVSPYPILSVTVSKPSVSEDGGTATFTISSTSSSSSDITVSLKTGGDYVPGVNLTGLAAVGTTFTATLVHGTTSTTLPTIVGVHDADGINQTATLTILPDPASTTTYTVGTLASASVVIQDDLTTVLTITPNAASVTDNNGSSGFTLTSSFAPTSNLTVNLQTSGTYWNGEVTGGPIPATGFGFSVTLPAGATTVSIPFVTHPDPEEFNNETVTVSLVDNSAYTNGTPASATITILDSSPIPVLTLTADRSSMTDVQTATFTVYASVGPEVPLVVSIASSGYAAGKVTIPTAVTLPVGATSVTFPVTALSEADYPVQNPLVSLVPGIGRTIGSPGTQSLLIVDSVVGVTYDGAWGFNGNPGSIVGSQAAWLLTGNVTLGSTGLTFGGAYGPPTDDASVPLTAGSVTFNKDCFTLAVRFNMADLNFIFSRPIVAAGFGWRFIIANIDQAGSLSIDLNNHSLVLPTGRTIVPGITYTLVIDVNIASLTLTAWLDGAPVSFSLPPGFFIDFPAGDDHLTAVDYSRGRAFKGTWDWVLATNGLLSYDTVVSIAAGSGL